MKILIVKTSSLGDIIQSFAVVEYLKRRFPEAEIDWVVENEYLTLIQAHPHLRKAISFGSRDWRKTFWPWGGIQKFIADLRKESYDLLFDLQGNTKSAFITKLARADKKIGFGKKSVAEWPNQWVTDRGVEVDRTLPIQQRYLQVVQTYLGDTQLFIPQGVALRLSPEEQKQLSSFCFSHRPKIMVACGSRWANKRLSEKTLSEFLSRFEAENPYFYFIYGNAGEKKAAEEFHALFPLSQTVGTPSIALWQGLMREMDLVIAVDSAALALCGTTSTPSISFFGPTRSGVYKPLGDHHVAWQGACPYKVAFEARCPRLRTCKTGACLKNAAATELSDYFTENTKESLKT